ncbi:MAG: Rne/Rng family ribonuclease [Desulfobulbaceae bacterium]|uniref:Ribonuclease G n=1 Tax=Candidatus Desulfatifera sulfidica TaxID=2841691 RepID=A0A8J6NB28_9BACT|nr:Rne/Rng family ribonuclease [Candidatus Desulfatifera sulfidica]
MTKEKKETGKKASSGEQKTVSKVTTGAWWKSRVEEADEAKKTVAKQQTAAKKKAASKKKPAVKKQAVAEQAPSISKEQAAKKKPAARKKSPVKKQAATDKEASIVASPVSVSQAPVSPETAELKQVKAGGKERSSEGPVSPSQESVAVTQEDASQSTGTGVESGTDAESGVSEPKKASGKRPRGRRGRGRRKKTAVESAEVDAEVPAVKKQEEPAGSAASKADDAPVKKDVKGPTLKLLINAEEPEECRIALLEDGRLESIFVSTVSREHTKSNIYKARIVAIEPNLQAAFVDYGTEKNGFLSFNEIHPEYYKQEISEENQKLIEQHQWKKLNIKDVLERGQELLVQVVKEEVSTKGANMTTYLSLPGRSVVLMPGSDSSGISRKISGEGRRSELREIMQGLDIPEGIGWIVRTASVDINKTVLDKDVSYLLRLWQEIKKKGQTMDDVGLIYQDHDCVLRFLRENFDPDIKEILVDDLAAYEKVNDFVDMLPTRQQKVNVRLHKGARPIFNQFNVEDQIESIYQSQVSLPSGGSIVIDPTEALVAIDVNSGSTGKGKSFEDAIFLANMEAATELARQLRLRDLGGLVVVDFIDMRSSKNIREVERQVKVAMKRDKAKVDMSRISKFGLMQISRQKLGAPIEALTYRVCEHCNGRGAVRSIETLALFYLRQIQTGASRKHVAQVECRLPLDVAQYLLNNKRHELQGLEDKYHTPVTIIADPGMKPADHEVIFHKDKKGPRKENGLEEKGEVGYIDATKVMHQ